MDELRKENCLLKNKMRDLESENSKLSDNAQNFDKYLKESNRVDELERENRKLTLEVEYLRYIK